MKVFKTSGVCCKEIGVSVEEGIVKEVAFSNGCPGNLIGIKKLVEGMKAEDVISNFQGTPCGNKATSCPDQLAQALKQCI